ncbi:MAG: 1-acyl-sn-glycerol-3-phosphate acyltransferase [Spirochaetales bacterium]|nr:1-acyl-sn-glycerol-3-phosphate acyltransferase [Spirochaetales bacterium]
MIRTIIFALVFWVTLILLSVFFIPLGFLNLFKLKKSEEKFLIWMTAAWSKFMFFVAGQKFEFEGMEKIPEHNRICFVANHQSYGDIPMVMGFMGKRVGFIAKKELNRVPILNFWIRAIHCIFIDRGQGRQALRAIETGMEQITMGYPKVLFPEGTRAKNGKMKKFKAGGLQMAVRYDITIVPITINGLFRCFEETGRVTANTTKITIHNPIETVGMDREERKALTGKIEQIISSALPEEFRLAE